MQSAEGQVRQAEAYLLLLRPNSRIVHLSYWSKGTEDKEADDERHA